MQINKILEMPKLLRIAVITSIGLSVMLFVTTFLPGFGLNLAGKMISHKELWESGLAYVLLCSALLMLIVAFGIYYRAKWIRLFLVLLPTLQYLPFQIFHWYFGGPNPTPSIIFYVVLCASWAILFIAYLYIFSSPRQYFTNEKA